MKKGFTIIELLGIIVIIGVISIVTFNSIIGALSKNEIREVENFENSLIDAASIYISSNSEKYDTFDYNSEAVYLNVEDLINAGFVKDINNPTDIDTEDYYIEVYKNIEDILSYKVVTEKQEFYKEELLNGADPRLENGMIPVTIENDGTVKKANRKEEWYSYENKEWANMVLVSDNNRSKYQTSDGGTTIFKNDILAYFVWIPRYKYKIPTSETTTTSTIDIVFENMSTPKSMGNAKTEYFTHPGFNFNNKEVNGLWVGKFEATGTSENPTILPNTSSLRNINISTQFETAFKYKNYGIKSESRMLRNTEWGGAAYLSHSLYGINKEIKKNNTSNFTTGCGANNADAIPTTDCQIAYGSNVSNLPQSTTGNITGIFDMSGGAYDYVMGNYIDYLIDSGFEKMPDRVYYNSYTPFHFSNGCNGEKCMGDATVETNGWYSNYFIDLSSSRPWISRGNDFDDPVDKSGVFSVTNSTGDAWNNVSFRAVIS